MNSLADGLVLDDQFFQRLVDLPEQLCVFFEEFFGDGLDAERLFDVRQRRVSLSILKQIEKSGLRGVATFAFADDVGKTPRRSEARFHTNFAGVFFDGGVFHFDVGEPPRRFRRRDERHEGGILFVAGLEVVGHEVADGGAGPFQFGLIGEVDNQNVELLLFGRRVRAEALVALDVVLEGILHVLAVP